MAKNNSPLTEVHVDTKGFATHAEVSVFAYDGTFPVRVVAELPEGVDGPLDEWYDLTNVPQWVVDAVVEATRPVIDALTTRHGK